MYTTAYYRQMCIYLSVLLDYEFIDFGNYIFKFSSTINWWLPPVRDYARVLWLNEQTCCLLLLPLWVWQGVSKCKGNWTQCGKCCKIYKIKKGMNGSAGYGVMVVILGKASRCEAWTGQELEQTAHTWSWQSRLCQERALWAYVREPELDTPGR